MNSRFFIPDRNENKVPLVIALPGIVVEDEPTRINHVLERLRADHGILGLRLNYVERKEVERRLEYTFNLDECAGYIEQALDDAIRTHSVDVTRIGIISNSVSALPVTEFLMKMSNAGRHSVSTYVAISPLLGWEYFANQSDRDYFVRTGKDIIINGGEISKNRATKIKIVPNKMIPQLMKRDLLTDLRAHQPTGISVRTILGLNDHKSDPNSIREYHYLMGGREEDLIELEADHDVPDSNLYTIRFLAERLKI